jgi:hypothetical protein
MKLSIKKVARNKVNYLIKRGKLTRNPYCLRCFKKAFTDAHHPDYSKPLLVEWLCSECHDKEHYDLRYRLVQERRKIFEPCQCGKKAFVKNMCKGCYMRNRELKDKCLFPSCNRVQHTRGLCGWHRQRKDCLLRFALPKQRPGPKAKE